MGGGNEMFQFGMNWYLSIAVHVLISMNVSQEGIKRKHSVPKPECNLIFYQRSISD